MCVCIEENALMRLHKDEYATVDRLEQELQSLREDESHLRETWYLLGDELRQSEVANRRVRQGLTRSTRRRGQIEATRLPSQRKECSLATTQPAGVSRTTTVDLNEILLHNLQRNTWKNLGLQVRLLKGGSVVASNAVPAAPSSCTPAAPTEQVASAPSSSTDLATNALGERDTRLVPRQALHGVALNRGSAQNEEGRTQHRTSGGVVLASAHNRSLSKAVDLEDLCGYCTMPPRVCSRSQRHCGEPSPRQASQLKRLPTALPVVHATKERVHNTESSSGAGELEDMLEGQRQWTEKLFGDLRSPPGASLHQTSKPMQAVFYPHSIERAVDQTDRGEGLLHQQTLPHLDHHGVHASQRNHPFSLQQREGRQKHTENIRALRELDMDDGNISGDQDTVVLQRKLLQMVLRELQTLPQQSPTEQKSGQQSLLVQDMQQQSEIDVQLHNQLFRSRERMKQFNSLVQKQHQQNGAAQTNVGRSQKQQHEQGKRCIVKDMPHRHGQLATMHDATLEAVSSPSPFTVCPLRKMDGDRTPDSSAVGSPFHGEMRCDKQQTQLGCSAGVACLSDLVEQKQCELLSTVKNELAQIDQLEKHYIALQQDIERLAWVLEASNTSTTEQDAYTCIFMAEPHSYKFVQAKSLRRENATLLGQCNL
ncbi:hypothetical protein cyc_00952 [Cyclospora cayetanensis]|uniref:Uncharacterized protein n=1 Tax=Cyclospora cayetanensis TaxID=88456 RepID=A0A1D3D929_9EIME|nr:hypothetical protein cyc_00952 [Cyclospora cayetanensis]